MSAGSLSTDYAFVCISGTGSVTQSGGTFTTLGGVFSLILGYNAGSSGSYTLGGTGSLSVEHAYIGNTGTGSFTQNGGTITDDKSVISSDDGLYLGVGSGGNGTYNLNAGSLSKDKA